MNGPPLAPAGLFAQVSSADGAAGVAFRTIEWAAPESALGRSALVTLAVIAAAVVVRIAAIEARTVGAAAACWLATLRLTALGALGVIALDPHERRQRDVTEPSRVALLVDASLSMAEPVRMTRKTVPSRGEAVARLLLGADAADGSLLSRLAETHRVDLFTFDGGLTARGPIAAGPLGRDAAAENAAGDEDAGDEGGGGEEGSNAVPSLSESIRPVGPRTGLGDAVSELLRTAGGPTLAGIAVISDGASNDGISVETAAATAGAARRVVPIAAVGVGDPRRAPSVTVAEVRVPEEVRFSPESEKQDPFDVTAFVTARADEETVGTAAVTLTRRPEETDPSTAATLARREVSLSTDGVPVQLDFAVTPDGAGRFVYAVRVEPGSGLEDFDEADNAAERVVSAVERNTAVLVIAGGPSRDYRFATALLDRAPTFEVDVWLQTVERRDLSSVGQAADDLLAGFPPSFPVRPSADAFEEGSTRPREYDAVVAFDADWSRIAADEQQRLLAWVAEERGGAVLAAGDVHQTRLGVAGERPPVIDLYPVVPAPPLSLTAAPPIADRAWPVTLTEAGRRAGFMDPGDEEADAARADRSAWPRLYRAVPTAGTKSLAAVYATLEDPTKGTGEAVVVAAQPFGGGRVLYLGSPETWRLRRRGAGAFERFWIGIVSEAAEGRRRRAAAGTILLDRREYEAGDTAVVRVERSRGRDDTSAVPPVLFVFGPDGEPLADGGTAMAPDRLNSRQFVADTRLATPGRYTFRVETGGGPSLTATADAVLPALERRDPRLDRSALTTLATRTGGLYCDLADAAEAVPALFDESAARVVRIDEGRSALWDRGWVLGLLIGLLSVEWLSRKLLKLA